MLRLGLLGLVLLLGKPVPDVPRPERSPRAELALSYLRFERAYRAHPPAPEDRAEVNREFDRATFSFLMGGFGRVARDLDRLAARFRPAEAHAGAWRVAFALRVAIRPHVLAAGSDTVPVARILTLYPVQRPGPGPTPGSSVLKRLVLRIAAPDHVQDFPFDLPRFRSPVEIPLKLENREPGMRTVLFVLPDGKTLEAGRWFVSGKDVDVLRAEYSRRLNRLSTDDPVLAEAIHIARHRNSLLRSRPRFHRSVELLVDPLDLAGQLDVEVAAILAGQDPYRRRPGHLWRVLSVGKLRIPLRTYAPRASEVGRPLPVVVALHGAGGDENLFPEGYGAGEIVRQAEEHGFVLASPETGQFLLSPKSLETLLDTLELHLAIDRKRVYLIGHSMGAMTTLVLAERHADLVAAACAIAGGDVAFSRGRRAPILYVSVDLDPIVPTARVRSAYERARKAGQPVEFRLASGYGHTLLVGDLLPECIAWLLKHGPKADAEKAGPRRGD
jgi:predicted esterase